MFAPDSIPQEVVALCHQLQKAGYAAYVVGGAVRDLLRMHHGSADKKAKDFDVATSAPPGEVVRIFGARRTIPTGIAHGTVTVVCNTDPNSSQRHIEVTTFRGETGYSDGRRPDQVSFITDLVEDLRRRDFTINAIAYDPLTQRLHDPFCGQMDLERRVIRAVGDPAQRFAEDGLRLLRAVRFAAQLGFVIDAATRAAFVGGLKTLRKVSSERVRDEISRLLATAQPSQGLQHMVEPDGNLPASDGLLGVVLPELAAALDEAEDGQRTAIAHWLAFMDAAPVQTRLAALLWPLRNKVANWPLRRLSDRLDALLKLPAQERQHLSAMLQFSRLDADQNQPLAFAPAQVRRLMADYAPRLLDDFLTLRILQLQQSATPAAAEQRNTLLALAERLAEERRKQPPLHTTDLALSGQELMQSLALRPGPLVGMILRHLLDRVILEPQENSKAALLAAAAVYLANRPEDALTAAGKNG